MSQFPNIADPQPPSAPPRQSNGLGVAGLIVSIVGLVTCGLLAPIGLILSLAGLTRPPRTAATIGAILGALGCLLAVGVLIGVFWVGRAAQQAASGMHDVLAQIEAVMTIETHYQDVGALPSDAEGNRLIQQAFAQQPRATAPRYARISDTGYTLTSPGPDGKLGTTDDTIQNHTVSGAAPEEEAGPEDEEEDGTEHDSDMETQEQTIPAERP